MAQDFRNQFNADIPTAFHASNSVLWTGGDFDAVISIRLANIVTLLSLISKQALISEQEGIFPES